MRNTPIEHLDRLEYVGGMLNLEDSNIKSLKNLETVGSYVVLTGTPLSKITTEEELTNQISTRHRIYM